MKKLYCLLALLALLTVAANSVYAAPDGAQPSAQIDLDLSKMSGTIVYSQIYNMMYDPEAYLGKVIRIAGYYDVYEEEATGIVYWACVVPDATACCAQEIEFIWAGEHNYPDDYPKPGVDVLVTGRLETYEENEVTYLHLVDADVIWGEEEGLLENS